MPRTMTGDDKLSPRLQAINVDLGEVPLSVGDGVLSELLGNLAKQ